MVEAENTDVEPTDDGDVEGGPEPFLVALGKAIRPEVLAEAGDELARVVRSVETFGKKASLTLKVDLAPMKNNPDVAEVSATVTGKPAKPDPRATPMWPDGQGRLHRNDPRQQRLPFGPRAVGAEGDDA